MSSIISLTEIANIITRNSNVSDSPIIFFTSVESTPDTFTMTKEAPYKISKL